MTSPAVERAMMHGLTACMNGDAPRSKVSTAMRNATIEDRHQAASKMLSDGLVEMKRGDGKKRGPTPMLLSITAKGRKEQVRLIEAYTVKANTIWG